MRKVLALVSSVLLVAILATPAQSAGAKYSAYQKTLATFSSSATTLTTQQKSQVKATVDANPTAEKFICTGIRYYDQPMSVNITVRKRAKAACEYAKQLNPALSTWFQNKPTKARSYAGKVLLTVKTATSTAYYSNRTSYCQEDLSVTPEFKRLADVSRELNYCSIPTRILDVPLASGSPETALSPSSQSLPVSKCKIQNGPNTQAFLGFPNPSQTYFRPHPGPTTVFQVIPLSAPDAPADSNSPIADYRHYFDLMKQWITHNSDQGTNVEIRIPETYFELEKDLGSYEIEHKTEPAKRVPFIRDVLGVADPKINFTGVNYIIFLAPPGSPQSLFETGPMGSVQTQEGNVSSSNSIRGLNFTGRTTIRQEQPLHWFHELYHGGAWIDDHYGNYPKDDQLSDVGMGSWGLMTRVKTDLIAFAKWQLGFMGDSQVHCLDKTKTSTLWIKPSQINGDLEKLIVIPTGQYTAVVIESVRAVGFNYLLPTKSEGALVYTIDTNSEHGKGYNVITPRPSSWKAVRDFYIADAPLKLGDSVTVDGLTIKLEEAGLWGDVVSVTPQR